MKGTVNRVALVASQVLFSSITPLLLLPKIGNRQATRNLIALLFGRLYGNRYEDIIASFQGRYGLAMDAGLVQACKRSEHAIRVIADCGTGTGFVTGQAARKFPGASILAFDLLPNMLMQTRRNSEGLPAEVFPVQADTFSLPLENDSVDLLLAQNTMPCFREFARVCRPRGIVVYVDSSAGWVTNVAIKLVRRQNQFESVAGERIDMGFYVLAQKGGSRSESASQPLEGQSKEQKMLNLLRCPFDQERLVPEQDQWLCSHGHSFSVNESFPKLL